MSSVFAHLSAPAAPKVDPTSISLGGHSVSVAPAAPPQHRPSSVLPTAPSSSVAPTAITLGNYAVTVAPASPAVDDEGDTIMTIPEPTTAERLRAYRQNFGNDPTEFFPWRLVPFSLPALPSRRRHPRGWLFFLEKLYWADDITSQNALEALVERGLMTGEQALEIYWG